MQKTTKRGVGKRLLILSFFAVSFFCFHSKAWSLPTGEKVIRGQVQFERNQDPRTLTIKVQEPGSVVEFDSFNVQPDEAVEVQLPSLKASFEIRVNGLKPNQVLGIFNAGSKVVLASDAKFIFSSKAVHSFKGRFEAFPQPSLGTVPKGTGSFVPPYALFLLEGCALVLLFCLWRQLPNLKFSVPLPKVQGLRSKANIQSEPRTFGRGTSVEPVPLRTVPEQRRGELRELKTDRLDESFAELQREPAKLKAVETKNNKAARISHGPPIFHLQTGPFNKKPWIHRRDGCAHFIAGLNKPRFRRAVQKSLVGTLCLIYLFFPAFLGLVYGLPTDENVVSGAATIERSQDNSTMNVTASDNTVIEWGGFNVAQSESVNFTLPSADASLLNRIVGGGTSQILGRVTANGTLVLVNQNGFYFGSQAQIQAGSFIASTQNISNGDFFGGRYLFAGTGNTTGSTSSSILNEGTISAAQGGKAILIADAIENRGVIEAPLGTVALAAGNQVSIGLTGDGLVSILVDEPTAHQILDKDGHPLSTQITNSGTVSARSGTVVLNAQAADQVFQSSINMTGTAWSDTLVPGKDGSIRFTSSGEMKVSGSLQAQGGSSVLESDTNIKVTGDLSTQGETTFKAKNNIDVNANVTGDGGLVFEADSDLEGTGSFNQATDTTVKTTSGNISISSSGESTIANIDSAGDLSLNKAGADAHYTQQAGSTVKTAGSLHINEGVTLSAGSSIYEVGRDWHNLGHFDAQLSLVKLVGIQDAVVYGSNTFYDFRVTDAGKIVRFDADEEQDVLGTLTLQGSFGNLLMLRSTEVGVQWKINAVGATELSYLDIMDSSNVNIHGPPLAPGYSKNSLGNTGWEFAGAVWTGNGNNSNWSNGSNWDGGWIPGVGDLVRFGSLSGNAVVDGNFAGAVAGLSLEAGYNGTVSLERDLTITGNVVLAGGTLNAGSQTITVGGNWSNRGGSFNAGTSTVVFNDASQVSQILGNNTFYNFTSLTASKILEFEAGKTQTILNRWDLEGEYFPAFIKIISTQPGSAWYVDPRGERYLYDVWLEDAHNINPVEVYVTKGTNRGGSFHIDPTFTWTALGDGVSWSDGANWDQSGATPGEGDDVVLNTTSTADSTFDLNNNIGSLLLDTGYTGTVTLSQDLTVSTGSGRSGSITINDGTLDSNGHNVTVGGDWTDTGSGHFTKGTNTVTFNGTGTINANEAFYDLVVDSTGAITLGGDLTVSHNLTINNSGLLSASVAGCSGASCNITIGHILINNGTFDEDTGTVTFTGDDEFAWIQKAVFYNLTINSSGTIGIDDGGNLNVLNILTIQGGTAQLHSNLIISGGITITGGTLDSNGSDITLAGSWTDTGAGTFTEDFARVTFNGNNPVINSNEAFWNLTVNVAGTATLAHDLTVNGELNLGAGNVLDVTTNGCGGVSCNITVGTSWQSNGGLIARTGTVTFTGDNMSAAGANFYNLEINTSGTDFVALGFSYSVAHNLIITAGTASVSSFLVVNGSVIIQSGATLDGNGQGMNVAGDWLNSGTFTSNSNSVTLSGTNQTITGSNTFFNLYKPSGSAAILTFEAGATQTITNDLQLEGADGEILLLRSSSAGTKWKIDPQGSVTVNYLDVKDSNNLNASAIDCSTCYTSGNNTNWTSLQALPTITISGAVYTNENQSTNVGAGVSIGLSINGGTKATTTTGAGGTFSFSNVSVTGGGSVLIFVDDDASYEANYISRTTATSNMTGIQMYTNKIVLSHQTSNPMTNAALIMAAGSGDNDLHYSVSEKNVTFASGYELFIESGKTYTPGGNVTADDVDVNGTFAMENNTITVTGSWDATGGTFTDGNVIFTSGSSETIKSNSNSFQTVTFNNAGGTWTLQDAFRSNGVLTITAGALDVSGSNYQINAGGWTDTGAGSFVERSGTVVMEGGTINSNEAFNNLTIISGGYVFLGAALDVNGNLTIESGATLDNASLGSFTINVAGNWSNAGTLNAGFGTVILDGTNQTIFGSTTFYNLTKIVTTARTLTFEAGTTQTISNTLTLQGDSGQLLSLRSSSNGSQWSIDPQGTRNMEYLDIKDSNNTNVTSITCSPGCVDNPSTNTNWAFPAIIAISGTIYTNEAQNANVGAGVTVGLSVNGAAKVTAVTGVGGTFSFSNVTVNSSDAILLFIDDDGSYEANYVSQTSGSDMTSIAMYTNKIVLSHQTSGPMTNALLATAAGSNDDDIHYSVSGGNVTFESGYELFIETGKTYTPGGNVTVDDIDINGTFTMGANPVTVAGTWDATGGTFTSSGTVTFTSGSSETIKSNSNSFQNITFDNASGTWTLQDALDANGSLALTTGTLDVSGSNYQINVGGSWTDSGSGVFTKRSGTVVFDGTGTLNANDAFNNLTINTSGTITLGGALDVDGNLTLTAGTLDVSGSNYQINIAGNWTDTGAGSFTERSGTVVFDGTGTLNSNEAFNHVTINTSGTITLGAALDVNGNLTLTAGTLDVSGSNYQINVAGNWTDSGAGVFTKRSGTVVFDGTGTLNANDAFNNVTINTSGTITLGGALDIDGNLTLTAGTLDVSGSNYQINVAGNWTDTGAGSFTERSGTVVFDGTGTLNSNEAFNHVTINTSGTITLGAALDVNGNLTLTAGTLDVSGSNYQINVAGNWTDSGAGVFTKRSGTVVFDGTGTLNANDAFNNVTINTSGTITLGGALDIDGNLTLTAGTLDVSGSNYQINVGGNWTDSGSGAFTKRSGTVVFDGTGTLNANDAFNNLTINTSGTITLGGALDIDGNLTLTAGTLDVSGSNYQINVAGNWSNAGTFTARSGTVILDGTNQTIFGSTTFYNLTKTVTTARTLTFEASTTQTISNTLTLQGASGQLLSLRSSSNGTQWNIDAQGTRTVSYLDVKDSNNANASAINCGTCVDNPATNTNWTFLPIITISGTVYTNEAQNANVGAGVTIGLSVNGGAKTTVITGVGGTFSFSNVIVTSNDTILLFIDDHGSYEANYISQTTASDMTSIAMYTNKIVLSHQTSGPMTNALLATAAGSNDDDIHYSVSGGNATFESGYELFIETGKTYTPGGTVSVDDVDINGTFTMGANAVTVTGTWDATGGAFTSSGTVTFTSGSSETIKSNSNSFQNITFNNASGTWTLQDAMDANGNLTLTAGTLDVSASNYQINVGGNWTDSGSGTFTKRSGTVVFDGTGTLNANDAFNNLTINTSGTITLGAALDIDGNLTLTAGTLDVSGSNYQINVAGNWTDSGSGTFTKRSGTVVFDGTGTLNANDAFNNLTINTSGTITLGAALDIDGNLTLTAGTLDVSGSNYQINVAGNWTDSGSGTFTKRSGTVVFDGTGTLNANDAFNNLTINTSGTITLGAALDIDGNLTLTAGTLDVSGSNYQINVAGNWTDTGSGSFTERSGTVVFDGTGTLNSNEAFNHVTINTSGTITLGAALDVNGNLTLTAGTLDVSASNYQINVAGNWSNSGTFTARNGTVILDGTNQTISGSTTFYNLTKTVTSAATLTFTAGTTQTISNTLNLQGASGQLLSLRSSSNGSQWNINPQGTRTVAYLDIKDSNNANASAINCTTCVDNPSTNTNWTFVAGITISGTIYTNEAQSGNVGAGVTVGLSINGAAKTTVTTGGGGTFSFSVSPNANDTILIFIDDHGSYEANYISQSTGSDLTGIAMYTNKIVISHQTSGPMTNALLATAAGSGDNDIHYSISGGNATFESGYELFIESGKTYTPGGTVSVDDIDINGTFTMGANAVTVTGTWDATGGTFTSSGTVTFTSGSSETITSNSNSFQNITFNNASGAWNLGDNLHVNGNLTITAGTLNATGNSLSVSGTTTVDTSTSSNATLNGGQRKSFFDTVNNVQWVFYYNGSAIEYAYSENGMSWTTVSTLAYNTSDFSLTYKNISGTGYVLLAAQANTYDVVLRRGTVGASSISFGSEITVFDGSSTSNSYSDPTVALDGNNYVWVGAVKRISDDLADNKQAFVSRSANIATGDLSSWQSATSVGRASSLLHDLVLLPMTGSNMALLANSDAPNIVSYTYNGSSWSDANTGGDYSWFSFPSGLNSFVYAIAVSGTDVYVGGSFTDAGGNANADYIARWDGSTWNALGSGLDSSVLAIAVSGTDVYVGGNFTDAGGNVDADYIARWDGSNWNALGSGLSGGVNAIAITGNDVYVGGFFTNAGGNANADYIARWNGSTWNALGNGLPAFSGVYAIAITGTDVYVGGVFSNADGNANANNIARWNTSNSTWNALGGGLSGIVYAIAISGSNIYVGGSFINAGGDANADRIARWDGSNWNALGNGLNGNVKAIAVSGANVYVGGAFTDAGGDANADSIARWDGSTWNALGNVLPLFSTVNAIAISGTDVYAGGNFNSIDNIPTKYIGRWNGSNWNALGSGLNGNVTAIAVLGTDVYVGGNFTDAGGNINADRIARWDGSTWNALGNGLNGTVSIIAISGTDVYVGGIFTDAGGNTNADNIARWDTSNSTWNALGSGLNSTVNAIAVSGSNVYVGGSFTDAGGNVNADYIARWSTTNSTWNALGSGLNTTVSAIAISGANVYVGGTFTNAGGDVNADYIARWDGTSWNALGSGLNFGVSAIAISGTDVYVGGSFTDADGNANADNIARWDGSSWNALGSGLDFGVSAIAILGTDVYAVASGHLAGQEYIVRWNGSTWSALGNGLNGFVSAMAVSGTNLYVGGSFTALASGENGSAYFSKWGLAAAGNTDASSEFSAVSDSSGNIHLLYTNSSDDLIYKEYTGGSWGSATTVYTGTVTSPSLSIDQSTGTLYAFWTDSNTVYHKKDVAGTWDSSATTVYSSGTNTNVIAPFETTGKLVLMWTNGSGSPYNVKIARLDNSLADGALSVLGTTTIDTSTSANATLNGGQRKTFFDTVNNLHWVFYYNGSAIEYAYSANGSTWTTASTLSYNTTDFSLTYKEISNTGYVLLGIQANTYDVVLRRGTTSSTSISFDSAVTVFDGNSTANSYSDPTVALDANNYVWVGAVKRISDDLADNKQAFVSRSANIATGDLSSWQSATSVGRASSLLHDLILLPMTGSNMALLANSDAPAIVSYTYNGSSWSEANTGGDYSWFSFPGGLNSNVLAIAISGSDIYIGGNFTDAGGNSNADYIARWDGNTWNALGNGLNDSVNAIAISGLNVYVGGAFTDAGGNVNADRIARWDGSTWNALGSGLNNNVNAIAISGSDIYVGGRFTDAGGNANADRIARWDGSAWNALGTGVATCLGFPACTGASVNAIAITGSDIYIGGNFINAGGNNLADGIARWDGSTWNALSNGLTSCSGFECSPTVFALAVSGSDLYVGGNFINAGGNNSADFIARWDGSTWNSLGTGMSGTVGTIIVSGSNVYAGGQFSTAGGNAANFIALWDGSSWSALGSGTNATVGAFSITGTDVYVGGAFTQAGTGSASRLARWNGSSWNAVGNSGFNNIIRAITISGSDVYVGGDFTNAGGNSSADYIVRWDGSSWNALGSGLNNTVFAITVSGSDVYVGGGFTDAGGNSSADYIARWDGTTWNALGSGLNDTVFAIAVSGSNVYVGGNFTDAGGNTSADFIARWNGSSWNAMGSGWNDSVISIAISGSNVYAGGNFTGHISRWDGSSWNSLGSGLNNTVEVIKISGSDVYAGGYFTDAGGNGSADYIARWNGSSWNALGSGLNSAVYAIAISGSDVYAGGLFTDAGGNPSADHIARWDGSTWNAMGDGLNLYVYALATSGSNVYAGGDFNPFGYRASAAVYFAKWGLTVSADSDVSSEFSAVSDSSGNIHLIYTNSNDDLIYKEYTGGSWSAATTVYAGTVTSPSLSIDQSTGTLYAFWTDSNTVYHKKDVAGTWDSSATTIYSSGTNTNVVAPYETNGNLVVAWTNGASSPFNVKAASISKGVSMDVNGNVALSGGTFKAPSANLNIGGNFTRTAGTFNNNLGTVVFDATDSDNTINSNGISFYNVTLDGVGGTWTLASALDINGNLSINNGTLDVSTSNYALNVAGDWTNSGTFTGRNSTVTFDGTNQSISGNNTFYNFTKSVTSAATLTFAAGNTQTITNNLILQGTAGHLLALRSSTNGSEWRINTPATRTIQYVSVKNSNNLGTNIDCNTGCASAGGNTNWTFTATLITISGTVYTNESQSANVGAGVTIALSINGGTKSTVTTTAGGAFSISGAVVADDTVLLFIDNDAYEANYISQTNASDMTGIAMYTNKIVLSHQSDGPMTNALLATAATSGDNDIHYSVSGGNATFESGYELFIESGKTYTPGGTVSVDDIDINGTFNAGANAVNVSGTWDATGGAFTTTGTVTFTSTGAETIKSNGNSFQNLTFNGIGGVWTMQDALDVNGNLTITAGNLDVSASNYAVNVAGNWSNSGVFTARNGTVTFDGGDQTINGSNTFYNLTKVLTAAHTLTFQAGTTQTIDGTLRLEGASNKALSLVSSVEGTQWKINAQGTRTVSYLDVKDSNNLNATAISCTTGCQDSGDNINWTGFPITNPNLAVQVFVSVIDNVLRITIYNQFGLSSIITSYDLSISGSGLSNFSSSTNIFFQGANGQTSAGSGQTSFIQTVTAAGGKVTVTTTATTGAGQGTSQTGTKDDKAEDKSEKKDGDDSKKDSKEEQKGTTSQTTTATSTVQLQINFNAPVSEIRVQLLNVSNVFQSFATPEFAKSFTTNTSVAEGLVAVTSINPMGGGYMSTGVFIGMQMAAAVNGLSAPVNTASSLNLAGMKEIISTPTVKVSTLGSTPTSTRFSIIAKADGKVEVKLSGGDWQPAQAGMVLRTSDEVRTLKGGSANIVMDDKGATGNVQVESESRMRFDEMGQDSQTGEKKTVLAIAVGGVKVHVAQKLKGHEKFEVKTPNSTVGVRGTTFRVQVDPQSLAVAGRG